MDDYKDITISDVDFRVYYEIVGGSVDVGGIYLSDSQVDLIDVISDETKQDMEEKIEELK